eukprot:GHVR01137019.1.p1 GENE.GHVR01137019.1~~GHVR01137019.1.p1  ORF type:complete len:305 (+),score=41.28 GHVR01137019.1:1127-2041(+)
MNRTDSLTKYCMTGSGMMLNVQTDCVLHLPVLDLQGRLRVALEEGALSPNCRHSLLSAKRRICTDGEKPWIEMVDVHGKKFEARLDTKGDMPCVCVCAASDEHAGKTGSAEHFESTFGGKADDAYPKTPQQRNLFLYILHLRHGHAGGKRLLATLKEKGMNHITLTECVSIAQECAACNLVNMRRNKIQSKGYIDTESEIFNDNVYHDLTSFGTLTYGYAGLRYLSVLIDQATRYISLMSLREKRHAVDHTVAWTRRFERRYGRIKRLHCDNGGEFVWETYHNICRQDLPFVWCCFDSGVLRTS